MLMSVPQLNLLEWDQFPKAPDALVSASGYGSSPMCGFRI